MFCVLCSESCSCLLRFMFSPRDFCVASCERGSCSQSPLHEVFAMRARGNISCRRLDSRTLATAPSIKGHNLNLGEMRLFKVTKISCHTVLCRPYFHWRTHLEYTSNTAYNCGGILRSQGKHLSLVALVEFTTESMKHPHLGGLSVNIVGKRHGRHQVHHR